MLSPAPTSPRPTLALLPVLLLTLLAPQLLSAPPSPQELDLKRLEVAPGFTTHLWASEPAFKNAVSFSFDEQGRAFIVETHRYGKSIFDITQNLPWLIDDLSFRKVEDRTAFLQRQFATNRAVLTADSELLRLVEDRDGDGKADTSSVFADDFRDVPTGTAAGVLARQGNVWFGNIPDLWLLQTPDVAQTNQVAQNRRKLLTGFGVHIGVTGHDLHGLAIGMDGKIYFSMGDRGARVVSQEERLFDLPDTGAVFRCNPDGSNLELFASGLRNPQELAFDDLGNLWTVDNDTAGPDKSRLLYLVQGGEYGWRCSYQHQVGFGPWVQEDVWQGGIDGSIPHSGEVSQGPAGFTFYPGSGFPDRFNNSFFICDFPGGVWSFKVAPRGAGYIAGEREKFLWKVWPTDVEFGPDSRLYVLDWVDGWQMPEKGRIYAFQPSTPTDETRRLEVQKLIKEGMDHRSDNELLPLLSHPDLRIRREAQFALANRPHPPVRQLLELLHDKNPRHPRLHSIWALNQILAQKPSSQQPHPEIARIESTLIRCLSSSDHEVIAQAAATLGNMRSRSALGPLLQLLSTNAPRPALQACLALAQIGHPSSLRPLTRFIEQLADGDAILVHGAVSALASCASPSDLVAFAHHASPNVRRAALLTWRRQRNPEVARFLNDPSPSLVYEAARAINDLPIQQALPALAEKLLLPTSPHHILSRAVNAHFRLGTPQNAQALAQFASSTTNPPNARADAILALQQWPNPPPLDRVMGLWRPLEKRSLSTAQEATLPLVLTANTEPNETVVIALAKASAALHLTTSKSSWLNYFSAPKNPTTARLEALLALAELKGPELDSALNLGLSDPNPPLRSEAIRLAALSPSPNLAPRLIDLFTSETVVASQQAILRALGRVPSPTATSFLTSQLQKLTQGSLNEKLHLDLIQALESQPDTTAQQALDRFHKLPTAPNASSFLLHGGDSARGRKLFEERADVACLRCHAVKGRGGIVGPSLDGLPKRATRQQILESILTPNASIANGFESTTITLKNGSSVAGTVKSESPSQITLDAPDEGLVTLQKSDIQERRRGLSAMPEGLGALLSPRELRDLVEFLAQLTP